MKRVLITLICLACLNSCVETYEPEVGDYESSLVVDGLFSDSDSPSRVILSTSFAYDEDEVPYISDATVVIEEQNGPNHQLSEVEPGTYETNPEEFKGVIGNSYRLRIRLPDGEEYETEWAMMTAAAPIGDITYELETREVDEIGAPLVRGIQFYLNTASDGDANPFYRWEWEETYIYNHPKPQYVTVTFPARKRAVFEDVPLDEFEGFNCWKSNKSTSILIESTEGLTENNVKDFPLHFVDDSSPRLYIRYSLLVKQYALDKEYHEFLRKVVEVNQTTGSLFDPIPNEIFGNVQSTSDNNRPVLGYFGVAGVSEKRIFVTREDLPIGFNAPPSPVCLEDTIGLGEFELLHDFTESGNKVFYNYLRAEIGGAIIGYLVSEPKCIFCEDNDASNERPDFW